VSFKPSKVSALMLQFVLLDVTPAWRIATILLCVLRLDAPRDGSTYQINSVSVSFLTMQISSFWCSYYLLSCLP